MHSGFGPHTEEMCEAWWGESCSDSSEVWTLGAELSAKRSRSVSPLRPQPAREGSWHSQALGPEVGPSTCVILAVVEGPRALEQSEFLLQLPVSLLFTCVFPGNSKRIFCCGGVVSECSKGPNHVCKNKNQMAE